MYTSLFFVLFFLLSVSIASQVLTELKQVPRRSFPYVVNIEAHEWCHGVLITTNYVLTNARCVVGSDNIRIYMGWYSYPEYQKPTYEPDIQIYTASKVIAHPDFKLVTKYWMYENDIALVKLPQAIFVTEGVQPAVLANPETFNNTDLFGKDGVVFGWWPATYLSAATVQISPHANCSDIFGRNYIKYRQFCVQWPKGERLCSHHSLPMEIDGNLIGLQQDDPQNNIECSKFEYKFINILYYYDWIMKNSDLEEYLKNNIVNDKEDKSQKALKKLKSALETTISTLTDSVNGKTNNKCKIDIEVACPKNKEA